MPKLKNLAILILSSTLVLTAIFSVGWFLGQGSIKNNPQAQDKKIIDTELDKLAVLKRIQSLNLLTTKQYFLERDLKITFNFDDLKIFNITILENSLSQDVRVSGKVFAGIDMSKLQQEDIMVAKDQNKINLILPPAEILEVSIEEDRTDILGKDYNLLVGTKILFDEDMRVEVENSLQKQAIKEGKIGLVEVACTESILDQASESAKEALKEFLLGLGFKEAEVEVKPYQKCELL
jgi:hypothetical protein